MQKRRILLLLLTIPVIQPMPVSAQSTMEFGAVHAGAIGLGAGLAASRSHGQVVRRSYEAMIEAEKATIAQTKAIEQYMTLGCQLESKKRWSDAEKSFAYVLKVVALRDGPGSIKGLPALQHLVNVSKQQGKITEAIDFQKTVVAFAKSPKVPDQQLLLRSQIDLTDLFLIKNDYTNAETVLRETITDNKSYQALPAAKRRKTIQTYANVLRKLNRDSDADALEAENAQLLSGSESPTAVAKEARPGATPSTVTEAPATAGQIPATASAPAALPTTPTTTASSIRATDPTTAPSSITAATSATPTAESKSTATATATTAANSPAITTTSKSTEPATGHR
ncbi:MAG: hypothetical protein JST44_19280 [Cyanobacteria bacterium SZAS LIN-5]|nr:hypothetical protein [Cyanobacteria bacterium SZAS LIN-5]